jgi:hypothetical protein
MSNLNYKFDDVNGSVTISKPLYLDESFKDSNGNQALVVVSVVGGLLNSIDDDCGISEVNTEDLVIDFSRIDLDDDEDTFDKYYKIDDYTNDFLARVSKVVKSGKLPWYFANYVCDEILVNAGFSLIEVIPDESSVDSFLSVFLKRMSFDFEKEKEVIQFYNDYIKSKYVDSFPKILMPPEGVLRRKHLYYAIRGDNNARGL